MGSTFEEEKEILSQLRQEQCSFSKGKLKGSLGYIINTPSPVRIPLIKQLDCCSFPKELPDCMCDAVWNRNDHL